MNYVSRMKRCALVLVLAGLVSVSARATPLVDITELDVVVGAGGQIEIDLISPGVLTATDDFLVSGTLLITPADGANFNPLFLLTDGSVFYGGELNDIATDTDIDVLASVNVGESVLGASSFFSANEFAFTNQANVGPVGASVTVDFEISNTASVTTAEITFNSGASGSLTSSDIDVPFGALNPEVDGLSLVLANLNSVDPDTGLGVDVVFDRVEVQVIPEPTAAALLGLGAVMLFAGVGRPKRSFVSSV